MSAAPLSIIPPPFISIALVCFAALFSARGGDTNDKLIAPTESAPAASPISWEVEASFSAVFDSEFKGFADTGHVLSLYADFSAIGSLQIRDGLLLRFGVEYQRFDFSRPTSTPIPYGLESAALVVGANFQLGTEWLARVDFKPGLYGSNNAIRAHDFNVPIELGVAYFVSADLQLVVGLGVDVNRQYPVLPAIGARWKFAPDWVLNAILPSPRLEYIVNPAVTLFTGADFQGNTYRLNDLPSDAPKARKLNGTVVDYTQIRVGAGGSWSINKHFTLEVEAGLVAVHEFDFHRADKRIYTKELPPYAGISLKAEF